MEKKRTCIFNILLTYVLLDLVICENKLDMRKTIIEENTVFRALWKRTRIAESDLCKHLISFSGQLYQFNMYCEDIDVISHHQTHSLAVFLIALFMSD